MTTTNHCQQLVTLTFKLLPSVKVGVREDSQHPYRIQRAVHFMQLLQVGQVLADVEQSSHLPQEVCNEPNTPMSVYI